MEPDNETISQGFQMDHSQGRDYRRRRRNCGCRVFDMPQGRIIYASCIGPGTDEFSCKFEVYPASGKCLSSKSKLERVREVSDKLPGGSVMFVPSSTSSQYKFFITIKRETYQDHEEATTSSLISHALTYSICLCSRV